MIHGAVFYAVAILWHGHNQLFDAQHADPYYPLITEAFDVNECFEIELAPGVATCEDAEQDLMAMIDGPGIDNPVTQEAIVEALALDATCEDRLIALARWADREHGGSRARECPRNVI